MRILNASCGNLNCGYLFGSGESTVQLELHSLHGEFLKDGSKDTCPFAALKRTRILVQMIQKGIVLEAPDFEVSSRIDEK